MFNLQKVTTDDQIMVVNQLSKRIWPGVYGEILTPEQSEFMLEMMYAPAVIRAELSRGVEFRLAIVDETPVGYVSVEALADETCLLHKLYLLEEYRGNGYGRQMIEFALEFARKKECKMISLHVNRHNAKAILTYKRCGLRELSILKTDIGNGYYMDDYIYGTEL